MTTIRIAPGTPETGVWCPDCKLPSAVRTPFNTISEHGVTLFATFVNCTKCHPFHFKEFTE